MMKEAIVSRPRRVSLLSLGLLFVTSCGGGAGAESTPELVKSPFRSAGLGHDHNDLTEQGLSMLRLSIAEDIGDANEDMDMPLTDRQVTSENHFDECKFVSSFDKVRERYTALLAAVNPNAFDASGAIRLFGQILHATQDFVSHSNWLESGQTSVINGRIFLPPRVTPGSTIGDLVVVQNGIPAAWQVRRNGTTGIASRQINIFEGGALIGRGLITGEYPKNIGGSACPPTAAIFHGDDFEQGPIHNYLAKDDPDAFMHREAIALAIRQTTEEYCRLDRMVLHQYGEPGAATLRRHWGVDATKLLQACPDNQGIVVSTWLAPLG